MKKPKIVLIIGFVLVLTTVGVILWHQVRDLGEAVPPDEYERYLQVIRSGDRGLLETVPEVMVHPASGERIPLRQQAADFLAGTRGEAAYLGGFYLMEPRAGQSVTSPVRVKLWHKTNHYGGGILRITDAKNKVLAELRLPEISHYNITYHYYEAEITFEQPATARGFIVGLPWDAKDGDKQEDAKSIPILFEK